MRIVGVPTFSLSAQAIALIKPRRGVFLIDLSSSIHEITHSLVPSNNEQSATLYAYPLLESCREGTIDPEMIYDLPGTEELSPRKKFEQLERQRPGGEINQLLSYQSDFKCFDIDLSPDENKTAFAIDLVREPEPLTTILRGVNSALLRYERRALAGDRVGVFGFDDRIEGPLRIRSTLNASKELSLVRPDHFDGEFREMLEATTGPFVKKDGTNPSHIAKFLFPQFLSNNDPPDGEDPKPIGTDIGSALTRAIDILDPDSNEFKSSENFIVLFSDGKSNCVKNNGSATCNGGDALTHRTSISNALNSLKGSNSPLERLVENGITLHTVLVSDSVQPHSLLKANPSKSGCLDDLTSRRMADAGHMGYEFVNWGDGFGDERRRVTPPYHYANRFYEGSRATGGFWTPLRNPCIPGTNLLDPSSPTGLEGSLHRSCMKKPAGSTLSLNDLEDSLKTIFQTYNYLDNSGRLLCDPYGRDLRGQIDDFIDLLMGQNPIRLVGRG
ncbi:MAG: VWA domain-containing protein [Deltaproteobacteria bacterium]|nr:VWA domain-containing protein [Deltaproteobacteria bacterium]